MHEIPDDLHAERVSQFLSDCAEHVQPEKVSVLAAAAEIETLRARVAEHDSPAWAANERLNQWFSKACDELERRGMTKDEIARLVGQI